MALNDSELICKNAATRIRTTMIGAISKFENHFGHLWGHFSDDPLTEEQEKFADLWDCTRNEILNQGNQQIRHITNDCEKLIGIPITFTNNQYLKLTKTNPYNKEG